MRAIEFILESTGLANRKQGDLWKNPQGDEVYFKDVTFYPTDAPNYDSPESRDAAISEISKSINVPVQAMRWSNKPTSASLAFGIAHFTDASGKDFYVGRYFKRVSPNKAENYFPNELPGGFTLQTAVAQKEVAGYKPTDMLSRLDNLKPSDIASQIKAKFGSNSDEARAIDLFMKSKSFPIVIPLGKMNASAFTNYFAEVLQPIALILGMPVEGNAAEAEAKFFGKQGFDTCTVTFSGGKTAGLVDSILKNSAGKEIILSTKAGAGAKASARNLQNKFQEVPEMITKYPEVAEILDTIVNSGYADGPLDLGVKYGLIDSKEADQVKQLRGMTPGDKILGSGILSKRLEKMYQDRLVKVKDASKIIPFYHMLAAIAYPVADYINQNTDFGQAAADILNHGALIQMRTNAKVKGESITIESFIANYPSKAVTSVTLSAEKPYYSTGNKGNYTFLIK